MSNHLGERKQVKTTLEDFNFSVLLYIVKKSLLLIVTILLFSLLISFIVQRYATSIYRIQSELMQKTTKQTQILGVQDLLADEESEVLLEIQLLKSKFIIDRALDSLPLNIEYYAKGFFRSTEYYKNAPFEAFLNIKNPKIYNQEISINFTSNKTFILSYSVNGENLEVSSELNQLLSTAFFDIEISSESKFLETNSFFIIPKNYNDVVAEISSNISVVPTGKTIKIYYEHNNPNKALDIIEAIANTFIDYDKEKKTEGINGIIKFLDIQIDNFGEEYYAFQDTLKKFRLESGFVDPSSQITLLLDKIESIEEELINVRFEENILDWFKHYILEENSLAAVSSLMFNESSHSFDKEILEITSLENEKAKKLLVVTPDHPDIILIDEQILSLNKGLINQVELALENLNENERKINQELSSFYSNLYSLPDKETAFSKLQKEKEVKEQFYFNLIENKNKYLISKAGIVSDYITLQKATLPSKPISPNKEMIWLVGFGIGVLIGLTIIAIRYLLYQKVTSIKEIKENTNANVLGIIPKHKSTMERSQVVVVDAPKSSMSEAFRSIRSNMEFITSNNKTKVVVTTSTVPGEGKTFIGINLASIFSLMDKKVVILDLDLRKPRLSKIFNTDNQKGISTFLIGKNSLEECLYNTEFKNLDFIPSGPVPPNPAELIVKEETETLIKELRKRYDYVFIDTPPVGLVTDAIDILKKADYPLYVVRAGHSERAYLENINNLIFDNNVKNLSVVLNDFGTGASSNSTYGYGYGYGYGAGYYSDDIEYEKGWFFKLKKMFQ